MEGVISSLSPKAKKLIPWGILQVVFWLVMVTWPGILKASEIKVPSRIA